LANRRGPARQSPRQGWAQDCVGPRRAPIAHAGSPRQGELSGNAPS
jgi:hypothetical protein